MLLRSIDLNDVGVRSHREGCVTREDPDGDLALDCVGLHLHQVWVVRVLR